MTLRQIRLRFRAAIHEIACGECRVTWLSWLQRLAGIQRGFTPTVTNPPVVTYRRWRT